MLKAGLQKQKKNKRSTVGQITAVPSSFISIRIINIHLSKLENSTSFHTNAIHNHFVPVHYLTNPLNVLAIVAFRATS